MLRLYYLKWTKVDMDMMWQLDLNISNLWVLIGLENKKINLGDMYEEKLLTYRRIGKQAN